MNIKILQIQSENSQNILENNIEDKSLYEIGFP